MKKFEAGDNVYYKGKTKIKYIMGSDYHLDNGYVTSNHNGEMKHIEENKSNCCNAEVVENSDVCSDCKEHSDTSLEGKSFEAQVKIIEDAHYER